MTRSISLNVLAAAALLLLTGPPARGQMAAGSPIGIDVGLTKLFGNAITFTARADLQVLDPAQKESLRMPMTFAALNGKVRVDLDMTQVKSRDLPAKAVTVFKRAKLDRVASVVRPDEKLMFIIYPGARCYARVPDNSAGNTNLPVEKTVLGRETVEGHPCVKNRVVMKDAKGVLVLDALTWNATDLKDFPVRIQTKENGSTTILRLRQIKFDKPDARQFEPPAGFKSYDSPQALLLAASSKVNAITTTKK